MTSPRLPVPGFDLTPGFGPDPATIPGPGLATGPGSDPVLGAGMPAGPAPFPDPGRAVPGTHVAFRPGSRDAPPTCAVPHFAPVRVRGGPGRLRALARQRRRAVAAGLAVTAAALLAAGPHAERRTRGHPADGPPARTAAVDAPAASAPHHRPSRTAWVTAPVRIADAAAVRLLRPGDRVDVIAADGRGAARVVAAGARVTGVPGRYGTGGTDRAMSGAGAGAGGTVAGTDVDADAEVGPGREPGALVVLSVPRARAARLAGAGAAGPLAVTLW
jgi:hypothetical protein